MNIKKFSLAAPAVFLLVQVTDFIFQNVLQAEMYQALWRKGLMDKMPVMFLLRGSL